MIYVACVAPPARDRPQRMAVVLPTGGRRCCRSASASSTSASARLAMYVLMPDEPNIGFITLVIFVSATLLGFASSAPAASACSTPPCWSRCGAVRQGELLAGLLLFRLLYYVVPLPLIVDPGEPLLCQRRWRRRRTRERAALIPIPGDPFGPDMKTPAADCLSCAKLASIGGAAVRRHSFPENALMDRTHECD